MPTSNSRHVTFLARVGVFALLAVLAYAFTLEFVYPRFFAPFVPFHTDEYQGVNYVAQGMSAATFLAWPRPLAFLTFFVAGHFGLAGSIVFYTALTLADLALAMAIFERFFLRERIAWWLALAAFILAIAGPGFYFSVGYDLEFSLAAFFGLLGMYAWESRSENAVGRAVTLCAICFVLCTLSKESFVPALVIYGITAAFFRGPLPASLQATLLLLPFLAVAVAFADDRIVGSPFVRISSGTSDPYHVSLDPSTVLSSAAFYLAPLFNAGFLALLATCAVGAWMHKRLGLAVGIAIAAFSLYVPYFLLPNHLDACYQWVAMPLIALLVPLAWVGPTTTIRLTAWVRVAIAVTLVATVVLFGIESAGSADAEFYLAEQGINGRILTALRSIEPALRRSHRVLVTGLTYPYHPWRNADFLSPELGFTGSWAVATDPTNGPIEVQHSAQPVAYEAIRWKDYDLILVFNDDGTLAKAFTPRELRAIIAGRHLSQMPNVKVVAALRGNDSQTTAASALVLFFPQGIVPFRDDATAEAQGLYPDTSPDSCCFLAQRATVRLAKPARARTAVFTFYVPDFSPFAVKRERVNVAFDGTPVGSIAMSSGFHDAAFAFPARLVDKTTVEASMTMSIAFVPQEIGINADTRRLSIVLTRVRYR